MRHVTHSLIALLVCLATLGVQGAASAQPAGLPGRPQLAMGKPKPPPQQPSSCGHKGQDPCDFIKIVLTGAP